MNQDDMKRQTKEFAMQVIHLCRNLPRTQEAQLIAKQLFRSATSVGANYRAVCRARSKAEFISKLGIVLEEADESLYWLELLNETNIISVNMMEPIRKSANEIVAILVASLNTAKNR